MATYKPSIPKGTRDFSPIEMERRNYIFDTIKGVFRLFGFNQIETPSIENLSTLMGKYGEEGDKLLFKILNSGDFLKNVDNSLWENKELGPLTTKISEKGLRYDLTVPFARFVVQHRDEIQFPFKRYQIQPVWRADRPQKGRYREFYQCDADIIGSDSLYNEVELIQLIDEVFARLGIRTIIKLNNRKILAGIAEIIGEPDRLTDITVAIDKIDKIGIDKVNEELKERGLSHNSINKLKPILKIKGNNIDRIETLKKILKDSETGTKGISEIEKVLSISENIGLRAGIDLDVSLARGLNYYTGSIIEVKARDVEIGSITGGGRYDNLTGIFGLSDVSGVGISFGADRIYDVMNMLDLYPAESQAHNEILFVNFGEKESQVVFKIMKKLRNAGLTCEIYPDAVKLKKQLSYASARNIKFVAIVGEEEIKENLIVVKDMENSSQNKYTLEELIEKLAK
ncbi:MAG: histidine--tRNA ligase [Muribaculaceae bacterium]|nr:histidine--tRNA ligase [Muribaculaceae bacterium]